MLSQDVTRNKCAWLSPAGDNAGLSCRARCAQQLRPDRLKSQSSWCLITFFLFISLKYTSLPLKKKKSYLEQNRRAPMQKENILQNFYRIQLFLREKITFVPWFIPKNGCDALATVAKGNMYFISGGADCKTLSFSLYLHLSPVKWA